MKTDKEKELEQKIRQLQGQVSLERGAYIALFAEVSNLVGRKEDESIFHAINLYKKTKEEEKEVLTKILTDPNFSSLVTRKIGNILLMRTGKARLVEGCSWHDNFWGVCSCSRCENTSGLNHLGKILMKVREELWK